MNDASCVNVTESWFKSYMDSEYVGLAGFCCEKEGPGGDNATLDG